MEVQQNKLCAILLGMAGTTEAACEHARLARACPYMACFWENGLLTTSIFVLPEARRWWVEMPAEQPNLLGLEKAWLVLGDCAEASSPWSRGEVEPALDQPPCQLDCASCPRLETLCSGCPAWRSGKEQMSHDYA